MLSVNGLFLLRDESRATYLRSTMGQNRLNHVMVLNIYKEQVDELDLTAIANEFVSGSEHRLRFFGKFA